MATNAPVGIRTQSPAYQAYEILHLAFVVAPVVAGADKFFPFLVNWDLARKVAIMKTDRARRLAIGAQRVDGRQTEASPRRPQRGEGRHDRDYCRHGHQQRRARRQPDPRR